jgi:hypothetical protein
MDRAVQIAPAQRNLTEAKPRQNLARSSAGMALQLPTAEIAIVNPSGFGVYHV